MDEHYIDASDKGLNAILDVWEIPSPRRFRPTAAGTNNLSRFVETPRGRYFLRIYQNLGAAERARYEHHLLRALGSAGLPFQVPEPIPARSGDTAAVLGNSPSARFAALFAEIPGRHPARDDLAETELAGAAPACLHQRLTAIDLPASQPRPVTRLTATSTVSTRW